MSIPLFKKLFARLSSPPPAKASAPKVDATPPAAAAPRLLFAWQELIGADRRIAGYRLLPRALDGDAAISGAQLSAGLAHENVRPAAAQRPLLIPLSAAQWADADFRPLLAAHSHLLITDLAACADPRALIDAIHVAGGRVAAYLPWQVDAQAELPVDLFLLEFHEVPLAALEQRLQALARRRPGVGLLADGIESWDEFRLCQRLGITYCSGGFAASRDQAASAERISESRLVVIDMLNQIRADAPLKAIAATAMRDPAVVVKLLEMANSPLYGLPRQVAGIEEAITLLGRDALYRWLSLAMFRMDGDNGRDGTLLMLAMGRAALLAGLARDSGQAADEAFLVGLLSLIDCLLERPLSEILARIQLPEAVAAALLRNEGPHAPPLQLAIMLERCQLDQAVILAGALQIPAARLVACYREALSWATAQVGDA